MSQWKTTFVTGKEVTVGGNIKLRVIRDRNGAKKLVIDAPADVSIEITAEPAP